MKQFRILHVDDDALMRDIVELALAFEPGFALMTCESGGEALKLAPEWAPDLILCDYLMPDMDGPAVMAALRHDGRTAKIPVIMMTARANADDVDRLMQLGAFSVIAKPFDPKTLAETVRGELQSVKAETVRYDFAERLRNDAAILNAFRQALHDDPAGAAMPEGLLTCVHKLAGAAGIFDMPVVSAAASALEEAIVAARESCVIERQLERLLGCIAGGAPPSQPAEPPRRHRPASAMPQSIGA